jgi:hypothetical protein
VYEKNASGQTVNTEEFFMDDVGNQTSFLDDGTSIAAYSYDDDGMNQLEAVKTGDTPSNPAVDIWGTYHVDEGSSVTVMTVNDVSPSFSEGNSTVMYN